jgi:hypothetical protein
MPQTNRTEEQKLATLRRLDQFRQWHSLDDKRYCLSCAQIITGHTIQIAGGMGGPDPQQLICPTLGCRSIPMDWVLPTAEVKAKPSNPATPGAAALESGSEPGRIQHPIRGSLRRFVISLRRST